MPVEIKEVHIKAVISASKKEPEGSIKASDIAKLKKEITKDVTEKIMRILQQKNER